MATGKPRGRPPAKVDPNTAGGRLRALREQFDLNQEELSAVLRVDRSMVSKYEDGRHHMSPEALERAAKRFDVTPTFILFGEPVVFAERTARLVGRVGAGAQIEAVEVDYGEVSLPAAFDNGSAFEVIGDSCIPIFEEHDIVVVRGDPRFDPREAVGRYCVVETFDDEFGYLKLVEDGIDLPGGRKLYNLISPNREVDPLYKRNIRSARPVELRILRGR